MIWLIIAVLWLAAGMWAIIAENEGRTLDKSEIALYLVVGPIAAACTLYDALLFKIKCGGSYVALRPTIRFFSAARRSWVSRVTALRRAVGFLFDRIQRSENAILHTARKRARKLIAAIPSEAPFAMHRSMINGIVNTELVRLLEQRKFLRRAYSDVASILRTRMAPESDDFARRLREKTHRDHERIIREIGKVDATIADILAFLLEFRSDIYAARLSGRDAAETQRSLQETSDKIVATIHDVRQIEDDLGGSASILPIPKKMAQ